MGDKAIEVMECLINDQDPVELIGDKDEVIKVYKWILSLIEDEKISAREIMKMIERDINSLARINI